MSQPVATETTIETPVAKRRLPKLPKPNAKKIVTYTLAGVGVVALAKAASNRIHRSDDGETVEVDVSTD